MARVVRDMRRSWSWKSFFSVCFSFWWFQSVSETWSRSRSLPVKYLQYKFDGLKPPGSGSLPDFGKPLFVLAVLGTSPVWVAFDVFAMLCLSARCFFCNFGFSSCWVKSTNTHSDPLPGNKAGLELLTMLLLPWTFRILLQSKHPNSGNDMEMLILVVVGCWLVGVCLLVCLFVCFLLSVFLSFFLSFVRSFVGWWVGWFVCLFPSFCLSFVRSFVRSLVRSLVGLFVCLFVCLFSCLVVCLFVWLFGCLFVCLFAVLSKVFLPSVVRFFAAYCRFVLLLVASYRCFCFFFLVFLFLFLLLLSSSSPFSSLSSLFEDRSQSFPLTGKKKWVPRRLRTQSAAVGPEVRILERSEQF